MSKPQIRFKGFEDEWEQAKVRDVFTLGNGYTPSKANPAFWTNGTIPWFRMEDIRENGRVLSDSIQHVTPEAVKSSGLFPAGSIIVSTTATIGEHALLIADSLANQRFTVFQTVNRYSWLSAKYLLYRFYGLGDWCRKNVNAGGLAAVSIADLQKYDIDFPSSDTERDSIADYFCYIDELIAEAEREVSRLEKMKQASLQKMFPRPGATAPEIRFTGFSEPWQISKLSNFVERVTRKNGNESQLALTISSLLGLIDQEAYFNRRIASKDLSNYILINNGEFAYNKSYSDGFPWGSVKRLDKYDKGVLSTLYIVFAITSNNLNSDYLTVFFDTSLWHNYLALTAAEGARNHGLLNISADDFLAVPILLPCYAEQKAIGDYFRSLDSLLSAKRQKLVKLRNIKQACLDKMFVNTSEL